MGGGRGGGMLSKKPALDEQQEGVERGGWGQRKGFRKPLTVLSKAGEQARCSEACDGRRTSRRASKRHARPKTLHRSGSTLELVSFTRGSGRAPRSSGRT